MKLYLTNFRGTLLESRVLIAFTDALFIVRHQRSLTDKQNPGTTGLFFEPLLRLPAPFKLLNAEGAGRLHDKTEGSKVYIRTASY